MHCWIPKPDPLGTGSGQSWLTPAIRDIQSDALAGDHKINYWKNGATPNLVIKDLPAVTRTQFEELVDAVEERHTGAANAFRTLYLTAGADANVIGNNFQEIDFRAITAAGETRIAMLSRVPATILQMQDGLQGSSLNAGNFGAARRTFAETWVYPTLQDMSKSLAPLIDVPGDSELWFDTTDIGLLREDAKDQAEIESVKAAAIRNLVDGGFEPESCIATLARVDADFEAHRQRQCSAAAAGYEPSDIQRSRSAAAAAQRLMTWTARTPTAPAQALTGTWTPRYPSGYDEGGYDEGEYGGSLSLPSQSSTGTWTPRYVLLGYDEGGYDEDMFGGAIPLQSLTGTWVARVPAAPAQSWNLGCANTCCSTQSSTGAWVLSR